MGFGKAISTCFSKFGDASGRASLSEYWWFFTFCVVLNLLTANLGNLITFIPAINAANRRLHDTGRSGWYQLLWLTCIGVIPLLIWLASEGDDAPNRFD